MLEWVTAGQLDIAIVNTPAPRLPPTAHHILDEEMMLAYGASNKVALPKVVSFDRIESLDIVIPSRRHGLRRILDDAAADAGFSLNKSEAQRVSRHVGGDGHYHRGFDQCGGVGLAAGPALNGR
jgi:DNA-binding transcriptional LysR family regulator